MDEVFSDLGYASTGIFSSSNANTLMTWIKNQLSAGKAVTFAAQSTKDSSIPLIGEHAYTVVSVNTDANGNMTLTLRNPWGIDGAGNDGNDDGYVTVTAAQAQTAFMGAIAAKV
jgi:hypothetical protein